MLTFGIIAGLLLLYGCGSSLVQIASCMKDIRSSLHQIQLETDGATQRLAAFENALEELRQDVKNIASVADSYDDEILHPVRRARADADLFSDM